MKKNRRFSIHPIVIALLITIGTNIPAASQEKIKYYPALAAKYGADDYGMKSYTFVILRTGPNKTEDKALLAELFRSHMENINKLSDEGKLIIAGPMGKNDKQYRGIFVLNTTDHQEALEMLKGDRAIAEGVFEADLFSWYGSAALPAYLEVHEKIAKSNP